MQTVLFRFVCYKREWRKCLSMVGNGNLRQDRLNGQQKSRCSARRCAITTLKRGSRNSLNAMSMNVWTMTTMHILCSFISVIFNTYWWSSNICVKMNLCYRWAAWYGVRLLKKFKKGTAGCVLTQHSQWEISMCRPCCIITAYFRLHQSCQCSCWSKRSGQPKVLRCFLPGSESWQAYITDVGGRPGKVHHPCPPASDATVQHNILMESHSWWCASMF